MFLSEVSEDKIYIGMKLLSAVDNPGEIISIKRKGPLGQGEGDLWIGIKWCNGKESLDVLEHMNKVKVEEGQNT